MAGPRQHVLPRFLIKGFASRIRKGQVYCWLFRKNSKPFETNINNVAVAKSFYTEKDDTDVDDSITEAEKRFNSLVTRLRSYQKSTEIQDLTIPEFIAHLEVRTRHIRETFSDSARTLVSEFCKHIQDTELIKNIALKEITSDRSLLSDAIEEELKKYGLSVPSSLKDLLVSFGQNHAGEFIRAIEPHLRLLAEMVAKELPKRIPKAAKEGHLKALRETLAPEFRIEIYGTLRFQVSVISEENLVLGDNGVLFEVDAPKRFKTFLEKKDSLRSVYLPISRDRVLIGRSTSISEVLPTKLLNEALAACSSEFFIAAQNRPHIAELSRLIGTKSKILTDEEIRHIVAEFIEKKNERRQFQ